MIIGISGKIGSGKDTLAQIIQYLNNPSIKEDINEKNLSKFKSYHGTNTWQIKKFADSLKDIACILIGCTREQLEDRNFKEKELGKEWIIYKTKEYLERGGFPPLNNYTYNKYGNYKIHCFVNKQSRFKFVRNTSNHCESFEETLTPRKLLQLLGTECGREIIHPNIWVNSLFSNYGNYVGDTPIYKENLEQQYEIANTEPIIKYPNWIITDVRFPNEAQAIKDRNGLLIKINRHSDFENAISDTIHPSETQLDDYKDWDYVIENDGTIEDLIDKIKSLNLINEES